VARDGVGEERARARALRAGATAVAAMPAVAAAARVARDDRPRFPERVEATGERGILRVLDALLGVDLDALLDGGVVPIELGAHSVGAERLPLGADVVRQA